MGARGEGWAPGIDADTQQGGKGGRGCWQQSGCGRHAGDVCSASFQESREGRSQHVRWWRSCRWWRWWGLPLAHACCLDTRIAACGRLAPPSVDKCASVQKMHGTNHTRPEEN